MDKIPAAERTLELQNQLWAETIHENVFVICKTPMAKAITRRTLLGYKNGKINAHYFEDLINQLKNKPEQFRSKVLKGSFWNREENIMQFDAIIGNPPYQEMDGGHGSSSGAIYNYFVLIACELAKNYVSMIMPARWMTGGKGKGIKDFRDIMIHDRHIHILHIFLDAGMCFNSVQLEGGICFFLRDS